MMNGDELGKILSQIFLAWTLIVFGIGVVCALSIVGAIAFFNWIF